MLAAVAQVHVGVRIDVSLSLRAGQAHILTSRNTVWQQ